MKAKVLTWEKLQEQDPKQTSVLVTYTSPTHPSLKDNPLIRLIVGDFPSREAAWEWCKKENIKRRVVYIDNEAVQIEVKLLRLSKVIREFEEKQPDNAYALVPVE